MIFETTSNTTKGLIIRMPLESVLAFILFAFVSSITPGPNNLMLLASGMNFGFRASIPHMLGICIGFLILVLAVGFGLGEVFGRYPLSYDIMKWIGAIYLLYLAWRIANAGAVSEDDENKAKGKPLSFLGAVLFQWVNPKAWAMAISAFSIYIPATTGWMLVLGLSGLFALINLPCVSCWTVFGAALKHWLQEPCYARVFNITMALLLLISLLPLMGLS